jgi:hypothetical protein
MANHIENWLINHILSRNTLVGYIRCNSGNCKESDWEARLRAKK